MYILELLTKILTFKKKTIDYQPISQNQDELIENAEDCEHLFLPLDSTNEHFACKYCGMIVHRSELKNKNIFEKNIL